MNTHEAPANDDQTPFERFVDLVAVTRRLSREDAEFEAALVMPLRSRYPHDVSIRSYGPENN